MNTCHPIPSIRNMVKNGKKLRGFPLIIFERTVANKHYIKDSLWLLSASETATLSVII